MATPAPESRGGGVDERERRREEDRRREEELERSMAEARQGGAGGGGGGGGRGRIDAFTREREKIRRETEAAEEEEERERERKLKEKGFSAGISPDASPPSQQPAFELPTRIHPENRIGGVDPSQPVKVAMSLADVLAEKKRQAAADALRERTGNDDWGDHMPPPAPTVEAAFAKAFSDEAEGNDGGSTNEDGKCRNAAATVVPMSSMMEMTLSGRLVEMDAGALHLLQVAQAFEGQASTGGVSRASSNPTPLPEKGVPPKGGHCPAGRRRGFRNARARPVQIRTGSGASAI